MADSIWMLVCDSDDCNSDLFLSLKELSVDDIAVKMRGYYTDVNFQTVFKDHVDTPDPTGDKSRRRSLTRTWLLVKSLQTGEKSSDNPRLSADTKT